MDLQNLYIPELQYEGMLTEKFINRISMEKFNWRPHPKSMSIKELSNHLAEIPGYITAIMEKDEMDIAVYKAPQLEAMEELKIAEGKCVQGRESAEKTRCRV